MLKMLKKWWDFWLWDCGADRKAEVEVIPFCLTSLESGDYTIPLFYFEGACLPAGSDSSQAD